MLPTCIRELILDYYYGMLHWDRHQRVLIELFIFGCIKRPCWVRYLNYDLLFPTEWDQGVPMDPSPLQSVDTSGNHQNRIFARTELSRGNGFAALVLKCQCNNGLDKQHTVLVAAWFLEDKNATNQTTIQPPVNLIRTRWYCDLLVFARASVRSKAPD